MFKLSFLIWFLCAIHNIKGGVIPIKLDANKGNKGNLEFALQLPNNDTVQIDLSFQLLTISTNINTTSTTTPESSDSQLTTTPTTTTTTTTTTEIPEPKYVTVEEAIEGFRQELIRKENDIAGIIESDHPFYRHFKLEFDEDITLTIRCTYDSNYKKRTLNISCFEYHEYETERILSNGEVELIRLQDPNYKTDVEYINAKNRKQVYSMTIS